MNLWIFLTQIKEEFFTFLLGAIFGFLLDYFGSRGLDNIREKIQRFNKRKEWKKSEKFLKNYESIAHGFEIVQLGWDDGIFLQEQVILTDEDKFRLPNIIIKNIRNPQTRKWDEEGKRNLQQYGIFEIQQVRESETSQENKPTHSLILRGHRYYYFDSMSTHFTYLNHSLGFEILEDTLSQYLKKHGEEKPNRQNPIRIFPSPISVGISLFCENGNCLVLTRRTSTTSGGGHISAGKVFNAVGENVNPEKDVSIGEYLGKTKLSPWETAIRGLWEEMGLILSNNFSNLQLHSFIWDRRILDYKFFGYAICDLHRSEIEIGFKNAPDYSESKEILFYDTGNPSLCSSVISRIIQERNQWSSEAIYCTISSLMVLGKVKPKVFENIMLKSNVTIK